MNRANYLELCKDVEQSKKIEIQFWPSGKPEEVRTLAGSIPSWQYPYDPFPHAESGDYVVITFSDNGEDLSYVSCRQARQLIRRFHLFVLQ